ncbi:MAG: hypothetical protein Q9167_004054 [Letrouitia subvulpina]
MEGQELMKCRVHLISLNALSWPSTAEVESTNAVDVGVIQRSYVNAYERGLLKSGHVPHRLRSEEETWHPLYLPNRSDSLRAAMLDDSKITSIKSDLEAVLSPVKKPENQHKDTKKKGVKSIDVLQTIQLVMKEPPKKHPTNLTSSPGNTITDVISKFRLRAEALHYEKMLHQHAQRLAKFIEISLVQIQEYMQGNDRSASAAISDCFERPFQKLIDRLSGSSPAFFAELAFTLNSSGFGEEPQAAETWRDIPTTLDLLKRALNGCIRDEIIHRALGYPFTPPGRKRQRRSAAEITNGFVENLGHRNMDISPSTQVPGQASRFSDSDSSPEFNQGLNRPKFGFQFLHMTCSSDPDTSHTMSQLPDFSLQTPHTTQLADNDPVARHPISPWSQLFLEYPEHPNY